MKIYYFQDSKPPADSYFDYSITHKNVPLIIDNGSCHCRVGWANRSEPNLVFKNVVARIRKERGKKTVPEITNDVQVGNEIQNIEAVRFQLKTAFDRNVVINFDVMGQTLDYIFQRLNVEPHNRVNHPILMTEPFLNFNYSRQLMSELLFESYDVPGISYCVDFLLSYNLKNKGKTGLIISFGYHATHVVPVVRGKAIAQHSRRINIGGYNVVSYLHRLLQLKYPIHNNAITLSRAEEITQEHSFIAEDYQEELKKWMQKDYYERQVRIFQLPYVAPVTPTPVSAEQQREKKKELQRRLIEMNARRRDEKLANEEEYLNKLLDAQELFDCQQLKQFKKTLGTLGLADAAALTKAITISKEKVEKIKQKIREANAAAAANECDDREKPAETEEKVDKEFLASLRSQREQLLARRNARRQRKREMAQRRTAAAQERMRIISQLARKEKKEDNFGMRDEDWDVYKVINKDGNSSDSDVENEKLALIESQLRLKDPQFDQGSESSSVGSEGHRRPGESHQLHIGVERMRAPEVLFQPSLIGCVEAGVAEVAAFVLHRFDLEQRMELVSNVFLTGGCASLPGMKARLNREFQEMLPFQARFNITIAESDASLSAWHSAQHFANSSQFSKSLISRRDYEEKGSEYLKEHCVSNPFYPTPVCSQTTADG